MRRAGVGAAFGKVPVEGGCIDFRRLPPGPGPNPIMAGQFSITSSTNRRAAAGDRRRFLGGHTGLNAGWTLEAKIDGRCPSCRRRWSISRGRPRWRRTTPTVAWPALRR